MSETLPTLPPDIGETLVSARPLVEYLAMFDLDEAALPGRRILDCPGGAASFAAEARALGADVVCVDPLYEIPHERLAARARSDVARGNRFVRDNSERYVWPFFASADDHSRLRSEGCERWAADRAVNPEHYLPGALPDLPFPDGSFDLTLSSHLLFTYSDRLDHAFHVAALLELARVTAGEVRVYPLVDLLALEYARLEELRGELRERGVTSEVRSVPYEFQRTANRMLVLRPGGGG